MAASGKPAVDRRRVPSRSASAWEVEHAPLLSEPSKRAAEPPRPSRASLVACAALAVLYFAAYATSLQVRVDAGAGSSGGWHGAGPPTFASPPFHAVCLHSSCATVAGYCRQGDVLDPNPASAPAQQQLRCCAHNTAGMPAIPNPNLFPSPPCLPARRAALTAATFPGSMPTST